jgi:hypothetical protein
MAHLFLAIILIEGGSVGEGCTEREAAIPPQLFRLADAQGAVFDPRIETERMLLKMESSAAPREQGQESWLAS